MLSTGRVKHTYRHIHRFNWYRKRRSIKKECAAEITLWRRVFFNGSDH